MVSETMISLIHAVVSAAAVYIPAYVLQYTLGKTLLVWFVTTIVLSFVLKQVKTTGGEMSGWVMFAIGLVPWVVIGLKFGFTGAAAFLGTGILAAFATVLIARL